MQAAHRGTGTTHTSRNASCQLPLYVRVAHRPVRVGSLPPSERLGKQWRRSRRMLAVNPADDGKGTEVAVPGKCSEEEEAKSDEYSKEMQSRMGGGLTYRHEDGVNYHQILPDLYVGSCMQTALDVDMCADKLGVGTILSLQQDVDMNYFNMDLAPIQQRCRERGIGHARFPIRDFDPFDLRKQLPEAVRVVCEAARSGRGPLYIHCTAGLGRAPAVAMAWMHWCKGMPLMEALTTLTSIRACNPKVQAIRQATVDLLYGEPPRTVTICLGQDAAQGAKDVKVAGLDVGWGQFVDVPRTVGGTFELQRSLSPGKYQYKWVVDGEWMADEANPTVEDGGNINNMVEVVGNPSPEVEAARQRILSEDGLLTEQEARQVHEAVCQPQPWWRAVLPWITALLVAIVAAVLLVRRA